MKLVRQRADRLMGVSSRGKGIEEECSEREESRLRQANDPFSRYLYEVRQISRVSEERIQELARERMDGRGVDARNEIVVLNLELAIYVARTFMGRGLEYSDLVQEANQGLIEAASRYDPCKGYKFSSYAYWWMKSMMLKALKKQRRLIRIPVNVEEFWNRIVRTRVEFTQRHGRKPSVEEFAEILHMPDQKIREALRQLPIRRMSFLDDLFPGMDSGFVHESGVMKDKSSLSPEQMVQAEEEFYLVCRRVALFLDMLSQTGSERHQKAFRMYYGLDRASVPKTLACIGAVLGVTRQRAEQLVKRTWMLLRKQGVMQDEKWLEGEMERMQYLGEITGNVANFEE